MDGVKNVGTQAGYSGLRGGMKVANDLAEPADHVSLSVSQEMGFLGGLGSKLKDIFFGKGSSSSEPPKEPGGWYCGPDGQSQWYPKSSPPPPKNAYGQWHLDTACGGASWYWANNPSPAEGPVYGPAFKPRGSVNAAPASPGAAGGQKP